jgi:hypothetical protein
LILCSFKNKFMFKLREDKKNKAWINNLNVNMTLFTVYVHI